MIVVLAKDVIDLKQVHEYLRLHLAIAVRLQF